MDIFKEIYQFLYISSIIFVIYNFMNLIIKIYGRFYLKKESSFILTPLEKTILWVSLSIIFTYSL